MKTSPCPVKTHHKPKTNAIAITSEWVATTLSHSIDCKRLGKCHLRRFQTLQCAPTRVKKHLNIPTALQRLSCSKPLLLFARILGTNSKVL